MCSFDHEMDTDWIDTYRVHEASVKRLSVAELRVLLVHYKFADAGRDAKSWSKADMVDAIAEQLTTEEIG